MGGLPDGCVVHPEIAADRAHDDLPRVYSDADLDCGRMRASHFFAILLHALLHSERGIASPHSVVLVGNRGAKKRHDPVAHHLIDSTLVAVHGLHHVREHRVEELACLFGITVSEQLHGALEVGEEHRDLLALAFEARPGGEDFLCEMFRGVALGGAEPGNEAFWEKRSWMCAPGTKLCCRRQRSTALGARTPERRCAFLAEPRALLIFVAALRA